MRPDLPKVCHQVCLAPSQALEAAALPGRPTAERILTERVADLEALLGGGAAEGSSAGGVVGGAAGAQPARVVLAHPAALGTALGAEPEDLD